MDHDPIIVVGAGIGGLACALRLAAAGHAVTVLERAQAPGGKMRQVNSAAGPVDAGPTVLTLRGVFDDLFAAAGERLDDHVTLQRQEVLARHWWPDGSRLDLFADRARSVESVRAFAGARAAREFAKFCETAERLYDAFEQPMMQHPAPDLATMTRRVMGRPGLIPLMAPHATLAQALAKRFSDPRLAQLFGRYATYVGGSPYSAPALLSLIWRAEEGGVWSVDGGMHALARAVADLAAAHGAVFRYGAEVAAIEAPGGTVRAVQLACGTRVPARAVVFNGDPLALSQGRLGADVAGAAPGPARAGRSLSAHVWSFAAVPGGPAAADLVHHNVFFTRDPDAEFRALEAGRVPEEATLYVCAEDRGGPCTAPACERFEIIRNAPPRAAAACDLSAEETPCPTSPFPTLARSGLSFDPVPAPETMTGPAGFAALFPGSAGSLYGQSPHGLTAAFQRPTARTPLAGLYLAGGGTHPGAGVPMAALSGRHAAAAMLSDLASPSPSRRTATRGGMSTA